MHHVLSFLVMPTIIAIKVVLNNELQCAGQTLTNISE